MFLSDDFLLKDDWAKSFIIPTQKICPLLIITVT